MRDDDGNQQRGFPLEQLVRLVEAEPEYPDPCPQLRKFIFDAIAAQDEEWILHMMRQAVRQTKECIIQRIQDAA